MPPLQNLLLNSNGGNLLQPLPAQGNAGGNSAPTTTPLPGRIKRGGMSQSSEKSHEFRNPAKRPAPRGRKSATKTLREVTVIPFPATIQRRRLPPKTITPKSRSHRIPLVDPSPRKIQQTFKPQCKPAKMLHRIRPVLQMPPTKPRSSSLKLSKLRPLRRRKK